MALGGDAEEDLVAALGLLERLGARPAADAVARVPRDRGVRRLYSGVKPLVAPFNRG